MDFFRYHGAWAPGVRLFRRRQFATQALAIAAMFMLPVAVLGWCYLADKAEAIDVAARQRLGVQHAQATLPVLQAAQHQRLQAVLSAGAGVATAGWAPAQAALQAAMARLAEAEAMLGAELGTANHHAALKAAVAQAAPPAATWQPGLPDAAMASHTAVVDAVLALIDAAAEGSGLALDADAGSRHLMDAALVQLPPMQEMAARLAVIRAMAPPAGSAGPISQQSAVEAATLQAHHAENLKADFDKALAASPSLADRLPPADRLGEAQAHLELLQVLDQQLADRVAGLQRQRAATVATVAVALALAGYLFHALFLVTHGGLRQVRRHLDAMAEGDLTGQLQPWGNDEVAHLMVSVAGMQGSMRRIVADVRTASSSLVLTSGAIASDAIATRSADGVGTGAGGPGALDWLRGAVSAGADRSAQAAAALDALAQTNAALLTQTAASAALLQDQASDLAAQFVKFKLPQPAWQAALLPHA